MSRDDYHGGGDLDRDDSLYALRHSAAHIMAHAVQNLWPDTRFAIGPPIRDGFYYDIDLEESLTPEHLERIEKEMRRIVKAARPFKREMWEADKATEFFKAKNQGYKVELIEGIGEPQVSIYTVGEFTDLCNGPHVKAAGAARHFKLLSVAGAYWRGDERNPMLQRIYGTAWESKEDLEDYLHRVEEAKRRDHRRLGPELGLFSIEHEEAGAGVVFWHPKGATLWHELEEFSRQIHQEHGYVFVKTPHLFRSGLWKTSGHYDWYKENMYVIREEEEDEEFVVKPMNCPGHVLIYKSDIRSYRDLPIRMAELGTVYRNERSGTLHGLLRVRGLTQDDGHIFCTPDQVEREVHGVLDLTEKIMHACGFDRWKVDLSTSDPNTPEKYAGEPQEWKHAEDVLARVLEERGIEVNRVEGEAVFYGPKIDIQMVDALERKWQVTTVQFDFNLPRRFGIYYVGDDGNHHLPVMIHRALFGAMERFIGLLIEHYGGAFPPWLAPVQAIVLPITDGQAEYAGEVAEKLRAAGLRVEVDTRSDKIGKKVRDAEVQKIPYMLVCGKREAEAATVSVRTHEGGDRGASPLEDFIQEAVEVVRERRRHTEPAEAQ